MTDQPSGRDLAFMALAQYKATAPKNPTPVPKKTSRRGSMKRDARDPASLSSVLTNLNIEQGWDIHMEGENLLKDWDALCPLPQGAVEAVAFDADRRRLDLRPSTHAYATQLRLLGGQLAKQVNDKLGQDLVRSIRVLPPGQQASRRAHAASDGCPAQPQASTASKEPTPADLRFRERAKAARAALAPRAERRCVNPAVDAAIARQDAILSARRENSEDHRNALWEADRVVKKTVDRSEEVHEAALKQKRREAAGILPRRAFDVA